MLVILGLLILLDLSLLLCFWFQNLAPTNLYNWFILFLNSFIILVQGDLVISYLVQETLSHLCVRMIHNL